jgi:hypothetical protein
MVNYSVNFVLESHVSVLSVLYCSLKVRDPFLASGFIVNQIIPDKNFQKEAKFA